jgi:hypothetical protein
MIGLLGGGFGLPVLVTPVYSETETPSSSEEAEEASGSFGFFLRLFPCFLRFLVPLDVPLFFRLGEEEE